MLKTLALVLLPLAFNIHPVHVSVLNIEHRSAQNELSISMRFMHDDLYELALHRYGDRSSEQALKDTIASDQFLLSYLNSMLIMVVNTADSLHISHIERKEDTSDMWLFTQVKVPEKINQFRFSNFFMMDIFGDQTNLVIIQMNGQEKAFRMDAWNTYAEMIFKTEPETEN